jgi:hypothetical protein
MSRYVCIIELLNQNVIKDISNIIINNIYQDVINYFTIL